VSEDAQAAEPGIKRGDQQCIRDFRAHVKANRRYSLASSALAHPFDDAYWQASPASAISRIDVPVLGCQSWQDGIASSQATELYGDAFNKKSSWFVGMNGPHGICESGRPLTMMVNFLRHYVAGADNGWQKTPHITILHRSYRPGAAAGLQHRCRRAIQAQCGARAAWPAGDALRPVTSARSRVGSRPGKVRPAGELRHGLSG
jgi:predicted acyl esterase